MDILRIKYQTSDLVPPPYAHSIELELERNEGDAIVARFQVTYLGREELTQEEIEEEGFTGKDDIQIAVDIPKAWHAEIHRFANYQSSVPKTHLEEQEEYWQIKVDDGPWFYPAQPPIWAAFFQEMQQAILEIGKIELPMLFELSRGEKGIYRIVASFANRTLAYGHPDGTSISLPWNKLSQILREIYSGEFLYEDAVQEIPKRTGLFFSMGDGWWFEVGKSYLNSPRRLLKTFGLDE